MVAITLSKLSVSLSVPLSSRVVLKCFAKSVTVIMPTILPASVMGNRRTLWLIMRWTATSIGISGFPVVRILDIMSATLTCPIGSSLAHTFLIKSRSVTMPIGSVSFMTKRELIPFSLMSLAASRAVLLPSMVTIFFVIMSLTTVAAIYHFPRINKG